MLTYIWILDSLTFVLMGGSDGERERDTHTHTHTQTERGVQIVAGELCVQTRYAGVHIILC